MKILIVSDTHRKDGNLYDVIEKEKPFDMLIHLGDVEGGEHRLAPALGAGVQQLAGGGDGGFTGLGAAQGPGEQIGHKQQPVGLFPQLGFLPLQGQQLVQAVDV